MKRISVVGTSCSGKSTFAAKLATMLGYKHVELDSLHWQAGWVEVSDDVMRSRVRAACEEPQWVIDGNYACVRDLVWGRADMIIWLDYRLSIVLWRSIARTLRRAVTGEPCCNGNRESVLRLISRNSIVFWVLRTHYLRRRKYPGLLAPFQSVGREIVRIRSPHDAEKWLERVVMTGQCASPAMEVHSA